MERINVYIRKAAAISMAFMIYVCNIHLLQRLLSEVSPIACYVMAIAFSVVGVNCLLSSKDYMPIIAFSVLDSASIFLESNPPENFSLIVGSYYAIYSCILFWMFWLINRQGEPKQDAVIESQATAEPPKAAIEQPKPEQAPAKAIEPQQMELPLEIEPSISPRTISNTINGMMKGNQPIATKLENIKTYILSLPECEARRNAAQRMLVNYALKIEF